MSKKLLKYIENKFQVTITNTSYIKDKNLYLLSDNFLFVLASKNLPIKNLELEFSNYKNIVNIAWTVAKTKSKHLPNHTKADKVLNNIVTNLKSTISKPIITQEATGKTLGFNWLAFTDSSQIKE